MPATVTVQLCTTLNPITKREQAGHKVKLYKRPSGPYTSEQATDSTGKTTFSDLTSAYYDIYVCGYQVLSNTYCNGVVTKNVVSPCPDLKYLVVGQLRKSCPGPPLEGVREVSICRPGSSRCTHRTWTDAGGRFEIRNVKPGEFDICVDGVKWRICNRRRKKAAPLILGIDVCPPVTPAKAAKAKSGKTCGR